MNFLLQIPFVSSNRVEEGVFFEYMPPTPVPSMETSLGILHTSAYISQVAQSHLVTKEAETRSLLSGPKRGFPTKEKCLVLQRAS